MAGPSSSTSRSPPSPAFARGSSRAVTPPGYVDCRAHVERPSLESQTDISFDPKAIADDPWHVILDDTVHQAISSGPLGFEAIRSAIGTTWCAYCRWFTATYVCEWCELRLCMACLAPSEHGCAAHPDAPHGDFETSGHYVAGLWSSLAYKLKRSAFKQRCLYGMRSLLRDARGIAQALRSLVHDARERMAFVGHEGTGRGYQHRY